MDVIDLPGYGYAKGFSPLKVQVGVAFPFSFRMSKSVSLQSSFYSKKVNYIQIKIKNGVFLIKRLGDYRPLDNFQEVRFPVDVFAKTF